MVREDDHGSKTRLERRFSRANQNGQIQGSPAGTFREAGGLGLEFILTSGGYALRPSSGFDSFLQKSG
jgi:hypothetical protein